MLSACASRSSFLSRQLFTLLTVFSLGLFTVSSAHAATYYVSNLGSNSNSGAQGSPFKTIQHAADVAKAGDTVIVAAGTYREAIKSKNDGTASARIRFVSEDAYNKTGKMGTKIISSGQNVSWMILGDFVDVEGFDVTAADNAHVGIGSYGNYTRIMYNYVHDYKMVGPCDSNGGAGINNMNYDSVGKEIIGNVVHSIGTNFLGSGEYCNQIHGIYHATRGGKVENNIVYNSASAGIHLWHAPANVSVTNNLSFSNRGAGLIFGCGDKPFVQCKNITVANNIFMNNGRFGIREYGNNDSSNRVLNNITYQNGGIEIEMKQGTASGNMTDTNPMLKNFQPGGGGDYTLAAGSPAMGKGINCGGCNIGPDSSIISPPPSGQLPAGGGAGGGGLGLGNCFK